MNSSILRALSLGGAFLIAIAGLPAEAQQPAISPQKLERIHRNNKRKAEEMMARDSRVASGREMAELEQTYQAANRNTRSPEAIEALKKVIEKWPKSNRAGCAALYLGRWTSGEEREKYLQMAIEKYSKSYYLDGTSVGGYARFILGHIRKAAGQEAEAKKLFDEVRKDYDDAQNHTGTLLVSQLN